MAGIATSIANHGLTSDVCKWIDRCMMAIGTVVDLVCAFHPSTPSRHICIVLIVSNTTTYIVAKCLAASNYHKSNIPHVLTHVGATVLHVLLMRGNTLPV